MGAGLQDFFAQVADPGLSVRGTDFDRAADAVRFDRSLHHPTLARGR